MAILLGIGAGIVMPEIESLFAGHLPSWINTNETTGRALLTTLIGAMFTVTGIVFSVSVVALSITASQLGPRLLRNFMGQAIAQLTLGICIATSIYCLLLLRHIDRVGNEMFVPHLSISLAIVLATLSLCVVVLFMHRVTISIQAPNVVAAVAHELDEAINRLYPEMLGESSDEDHHPPQEATNCRKSFELNSTGEGYLQAIDAPGVMELATEYDVRLQLYRKPGDFVVKDTPLASVIGIEEEHREELTEKFSPCHIFGPRPTPRQDVECAIREMVEIAVRALSPGINDPFTAISCIDRLGASISRLANRKFPSPHRYDREGRLRVVASQSTFEELFESTFDTLRRYSSSSICVTMRLLEALERISLSTIQPGISALVARQVDMIVECSADQISCDSDRKKLFQMAERINPLGFSKNRSQKRLKSTSI